MFIFQEFTTIKKKKFLFFTFPQLHLSSNHCLQDALDFVPPLWGYFCIFWVKITKHFKLSLFQCIQGFQQTIKCVYITNS